MKRVASAIVPLIAIDRKAPKPFHTQIYDAYRSAVIDGSLRPGQRIPSSRELASELGLSREPVINAYAQLLAEGYLESRVGSGTRISKALPDRFSSTRPAARLAVTSVAARKVARRISGLPQFERPAWMRGHGAFTVGQIAADHFPNDIWWKLVARHSRNLNPATLDYGDPMGSKRLRELLATYLRTARSVRCDSQQIIIVSGSQQAIEIAGCVLLDPGSPVWVEEPGYTFARNALTLLGCRLVPIPVDSEGLNVAVGIERCRNACAAMVTPSHQFPLGATMSAARRLQLLEWAAKTNSWIIEDDFDSEFRYESPPISSLHGLDASGRVIYVGTFSKVLFPALRLGYLVAPPDMMERFLAVRRAMDLGPPTFHQEVVADFIEEGHFARHIRRMRVLYDERRRALVEALRSDFGPGVRIVGDEAGLQLVLAAPAGTPDREIAERAARQGIWLWPLSTTYLSQARQPGFILGFGNISAEKIPSAVRKLRLSMH